MSIPVQLALRAEAMKDERGEIIGVRFLAEDERADVYLALWAFGVTQRCSFFGFREEGITLTNGAERVFVRIADPEELAAMKSAIHEHRGMDYDDNELRLGLVG